MKPFAIFTLIFFLLVSDLFGEIRNGYEAQLQNAVESLQRLKALLVGNSELSPSQQRRIRSGISDMIDYISYYELTEELLDQLKMITPDIYDEIDNIRDRRGRRTDVYVKLIPREEALIDLEGATFFSPTVADEDACSSAYGEGSVSVKIWIADNALRLLYHELGHVRYIVPNLANYIKFYRKHYIGSRIEPSYIGHNIRDQSGVLAREYELRFRIDYANYLRNGGLRFDSALSLMQRIRKNNRNLTMIIPSYRIDVRRAELAFLSKPPSDYT